MMFLPQKLIIDLYSSSLTLEVKAMSPNPNQLLLMRYVISKLIWFQSVL